MNVSISLRAAELRSTWVTGNRQPSDEWQVYLDKSLGVAAYVTAADAREVAAAWAALADDLAERERIERERLGACTEHTAANGYDPARHTCQPEVAS